MMKSKTTQGCFFGKCTRYGAGVYQVQSNFAPLGGADRAFRVSPGNSPDFPIDISVPINQLHELVGACRKAGIEDRARMLVIHGGGHGGEEFYDAKRIKIVAEFLKSDL